ncbi:MAG: hypothetical protein GC191_03140 [Azospirillum sp.]|nr:hypothetical protein [Azospirillum sp.]
MNRTARTDKEPTQAKCRTLIQAADEALAWINGNREMIGPASGELRHAIHRIGRRARRLGAALDQPMCVALYGPSQSGKSYLVSALGASGEEPITIVFPGASGRNTYDFLADINPEGEKESTGLVTRFSTRPSLRTPAGAPVAFRLLTHTDLIKILANTFALDGDEADTTPLNQEAVVDRINEVEARASGVVVGAGALTSDDIFDIQEYVEDALKNRGFYRTLASAGFWPVAARLAPILPMEQFKRLLSLLWADNETFSGLYERLHQALAQLDFAAFAFAGIEALIPRNNSVIDVNALSGLSETKAEQRINVITASGRSAVLPRPVVAALVAELHLTMRESPHRFLEMTDILDFPGARSREDFNRLDSYLKRPNALEGLYLRGKVAYLFDRYSYEQEITSMLLCLQPGNQEVATLPATINNWVARTHGAKSAERLGQESLLFLILTKFDLVLKAKKGQIDASEARWTNRIETALDAYLAKAFDWPKEWVPGQPFNNTFWLRNPGVMSPDLFDYEGRTETAIRESESGRLASYHEQYMLNPSIKRHFADPERAWNAAFKLNDGGVSYLIECLSRVCDPRIKWQQIDGQIETLARLVVERLSGYYFEEHLEKELERRRQRAIEIITRIADTAESGRFGQLVAAFQIDAAQLEAEHHAMLNRSKKKSGQTETGINPIPGRTVTAQSLLNRVLPQQAVVAVSEQPQAPPRDEVAAYAAAALEGWARDSAVNISDATLANRLGLAESDLATISRELLAAAERLRLGQQIESDVRNILRIRQTPAKSAVWPAMIASERINTFVQYLGYTMVPEQDRPKLRFADGRELPIFIRTSQASGIEQLSEEPLLYEDDLISSWMSGFLELVDRNVRTRHGQAYDLAENARLGRVILSLRNLPQATNAGR